MRLIKDIRELPPDEIRAACIGNFDGLHRGHRLILSVLGSQAVSIGAKTAVLTFSPHPVKFFGGSLELLDTPRKRLELFEEQGVDYFVEVPFDDGLAALLPEEFFRRFVSNALNAKVVVVGEDYRFGREKEGDAEALKRLGTENGVRCVSVEKVRDESGERISSTLVRRLLKEGRPEKAADFLGRPYSMEGTIVRGDGKGREFGFPTVNIDFENELIPAYGVYATDILLCGGKFPSVTYVGRRPTIGKGLELRVETNVFGFDRNVYGEFAEVFFKRFIRGDMKFDTPEALKERMKADSETARRIALED